MIHSDHESLKHIKDQGKLNCRHGKRIEFIESFLYVIKYKPRMGNVIIHALSRRYALLSNLRSKFLGFKHIKEMYTDDKDISSVYHACEHYC